MEPIFAALADPIVRDWYLGLCFAVLVLPMIALAWWYHASIGNTQGGRALMEEHARIGVPDRTRPVAAFEALWRSLALAKDIAAGRYGVAARQAQNQLYVVVGLWLVVNAVLFGLLIWADAVNGAAG
ncbi:MAG: hypothetical protein KIT36_20430 [Alphaproteobacteria bacterium]|nr:hypothetical protein [Alphaproteobacteria bacterium]